MSGDPTAFSIDFDPTVQRMRGTAVHGNTPFDVPFASEIIDGLWQGGCQDGLVLPRQIKHLVSLYPWESYRINHELDSAVVVRMYDAHGGADMEQVDLLGAWVAKCWDRAPVLVHCQAGLNRSSLVVVSALVHGGLKVGAAIDTVRQKRSPACLCNESFERELRRFYS